MKANQAAFEIGQMADRMAQGYYTYVASIQIATDPRAPGLIEPYHRRSGLCWRILHFIEVRGERLSILV